MHAGRLVAERFATAHARGRHYRLLAALEEFGPRSKETLGRRTTIDRNDVVVVVDELVAGG